MQVVKDYLIRLYALFFYSLQKPSSVDINILERESLNKAVVLQFPLFVSSPKPFDKTNLPFHFSSIVGLEFSCASTFERQKKQTTKYLNAVIASSLK